jgi:uncharacterized membrane protein YhaH (DUF805 family)
MDFKALFLSPTGRIGRQEFWIGFLILCVAAVVASLLSIFGLILHLVLIYFWVCVFAKRLHDMGKSAVLAVIPYAVWIVAGVIMAVAGGAALFSGAFSDNSSQAAAFVGGGIMGVLIPIFLAIILNLAFVLWCGLSPSQPGDNQYGAPPQAHPLGAMPVSASTSTTPPQAPPPPPSEPPAV